MKFGVHLPQIGRSATREGIRDFAQMVEELGFDSVWVSDHVVVPRRIRSRYPYSRSGQFPMPPDLPFLEPLSALGFVAGCTERVSLGTTVLVVPMRNPVLAAKQLASLDVLSGGRLIFGAGAGWMEEEFQALDAPFGRRGRRLDECLTLIRALWTEPNVDFEGEFYSLHDVGFAPRPLQKPHPPIWVGGHGDAARRRAALLGDAWHAIGLAPERLAELHATVRDTAREAGRGADIAVTLRLGVRLDPEALPEVIEQLSAYRDAGVSHFVLEPAGMQDAEATAKQLERFQSEALPQIKRLGATLDVPDAED